MAFCYNYSMDETVKVLNQDERVIWKGHPKFLPYISKLFVFLIFAVLFLLLFLSPKTHFVAISQSTAVTGWWVVVVGTVLYTLLSYKNIWYLITDKRVILQRGLIGRDFDIADYDKFESADLHIGIIDKIFGTGSIRIYAGRLVYHSGSQYSRGGTENAPFVMANIGDPYTVFELLKKTSFDVKADINYPNVLRPGENKGYQTKYDPTDKI